MKDLIINSNLHKNKTTSQMENIKKLKAQIRILNAKIQKGQVKNSQALQEKIKALKEQLVIEMENHYWENYLSI